MANKSEVIVEINEKKTVATIFLNRPEKANSLNANMVTILRKSFQDLEANNEVRVIVLTGSGKYFCSGMDLSSQSHSVEDTTKGFIELMETIYKCKKPVICKINGPALGGGLGLVFVTDIRIMNKESYLVFPEVKRGIVPAMISAYIVPQLGIYKSKQYMLSGEKISSSELLNDRVISLLANDSSSLDKMTDSVVNQLISSAPNAMSIVKQLVDYVYYNSHKDNLAYVQKVFSDVVQSEEASFGISAFMQRKTPEWNLLNKSKL